VTLSPVQVRNGNDLSADVVVKSVDTIGVDEAIADPAAGPHGLRDVTQYLPSQSIHTHTHQSKS